MDHLRDELVSVALLWESAFGNAPSITSVLSEYDAARLVTCTVEQYSECMKGFTAVQRGHDFIFNGAKYQVKGNVTDRVASPVRSSRGLLRLLTTSGTFLSGFSTTGATSFRKRGSGKLTHIDTLSITSNVSHLLT